MQYANPQAEEPEERGRSTVRKIVFKNEQPKEINEKLSKIEQKLHNWLNNMSKYDTI